MKNVGPSGIVAVFYYYRPTKEALEKQGGMLAAALNQKRDKPKEEKANEHDEMHNRFKSDPS